MANLPPGMPARYNPVASELAAGPASSQLRQSLQQEMNRREVREETAEAAANALAHQAKKSIQLALVQQGSGDPRSVLPGLTAIADQPDLLNNIGL
jgi:hypothetical protein